MIFCSAFFGTALVWRKKACLDIHCGRHNLEHTIPPLLHLQNSSDWCWITASGDLQLTAKILDFASLRLEKK